MTYLTGIIFAKRVLGIDFVSDYIDWAGDMLTREYDSRNLRILASTMRSASTSEAEDYFLRCVKELQIIEPGPETAVPEYACYFARQILDGQLTSREGVRALYRLRFETDDAPEFLVWSELDDALDSLTSGNSPYYYRSDESVTPETFDTVVKQEAERFIVRMTKTG